MTQPKILRHPLTRMPLVPIGMRKDGRAIWPILGGSEPPAQTPSPETPPAEPDKTFTQADVDRIVGEAKRKAKPGDYDDLKAAAKKLADIEAASASDLEKAVTKAQQETESRVRAEVTKERVLDRIEVLAAKDFADPEDARLRLGSRVEDFVGADGKVDADGIKTALAALLKDKPHLSAVQPDGRPKGNADLGPRDTPPPANAKAADLQQIEADLRNASRR